MKRSPLVDNWSRRTKSRERPIRRKETERKKRCLICAYVRTSAPLAAPGWRLTLAVAFSLVAAKGATEIAKGSVIGLNIGVFIQSFGVTRPGNDGGL